MVVRVDGDQYPSSEVSQKRQSKFTYVEAPTTEIEAVEAPTAEIEAVEAPPKVSW